MGYLPDDSAFCEIKRLFSPEIASEIQRHFPSMAIYIAMQPREKSAIACAVGIDIAQQLSAHFGGEWIWIPSGKKELRQAIAQDRVDLILELNEKGLIKSEIARRALCSERWVYKVLSGHAASCHSRC